MRLMSPVSFEALDEKNRLDKSSGHGHDLRLVCDWGDVKGVFVWGEIVTITFYDLLVSKMNSHLRLYHRHD